MCGGKALGLILHKLWGSLGWGRWWGLFGGRELPTAVIALMVFPYAHRQQDLYRILKAYTIYRPDEGYCQAQAPVAAVLLMHMPAEVSRRRTWSGRGWACRGDRGALCPLFLWSYPSLLVLVLLSKPSGAWCRSATSTSLVTTAQGW